MAVKYTIPYKSIDDAQWRVDILHDAWTDPAISVRGYGDNACTIKWDGGVDDPFDNPVVPSSATIQLINQSELDMDELQYASDRDFIVEVYRENVLKWKGYLVTDNIHQPYQSAPYVVQLSAIDGLNMLEGIEYTHQNLNTSGQGIANRAPLNFLRQVLFSQANLGLMLPIRWSIDLENVSTSDDPIAGEMTWSPYGEGFIDGYYEENGFLMPRYKSCRYIVEGIVKAFGARIYQADGAWTMSRPNDVIDGTFRQVECNATLGNPTITTSVVNGLKLLSPEKVPAGEYKFIREDQLITVKPALGMVDVEYDADRRENIVPNGGMDQWSYSMPSPLLYWGFLPDPDTNPNYEELESLTGQPGSAVQVTNSLPSATEDAVFTFHDGLPVDANILFKRMTFGFTFMPTEFGFPLDGGGNIDWSTNPLKISVMYRLPIAGSDGDFYLNEFGYWQNGSRGTDLGVTFLRRQTTFAGPPLSIFTHRMYFQGTPNIGDELVLRISPHATTPYTDYSFVVTALEGGNLGLALDGLMSAISSSPTGSRSVTMVNSTEGYLEFTQSATVFTPPAPQGSTRKSGAIQDYEFIYPTVNALKPLDIANIVFQGKGGNTEILIPDPGLLDGQQDPVVGKLYVRFYVKPGQRYALDEVWVRTEDNNDVYRVESPVSGNNKSQRITIPISSSFNGFMTSNLMRSYHQSNEDFVWSDGETEASLTEHYARSVMRWRYKPSKIFNGTISTRMRDWSMMEVYSIYGLNDSGKFLPTNAEYNTEMCEVKLVAMEGRDDGEITDVKHYASNNMPLSNYGG